MAEESMHVNTARKINVLSKSSIILDGNWNYKNVTCVSHHKHETYPNQIIWCPGVQHKASAG